MGVSISPLPFRQDSIIAPSSALSASTAGTAKPRTRTSGSASAAKKAATATKTTSSAKGASAKKTSKEEE